MTHGEEFLDQLIEDLAEAEDIINYMEQQKHSILDDVDKLKGLCALFFFSFCVAQATNKVTSAPFEAEPLRRHHRARPAD